MGKKTTWRFQILNDFGVNFKCHMWHDELEKKDFSSIVKWTHENIISKNHHLDDRTKETSYWDKYNLFVEMKDDDTIQYIQKSIKKSYKEFVKTIEGEEKEVYLNGWLNVMTKDMNLLRHCHANHENSYLSGNLLITEPTTSRTSFALPDWFDPTKYHVHHEQNKLGHFNLFPQWLHHWVDPIDEDLRIVIGFDLHLKESVDYYWENESHTDWPIKRAIKL